MTPVRRVAGREVTTIEGMPAAQRDRWADAFVATGASQCGFCTPGIVLRLAALEAAGPGRAASRRDVEGALRAHLCRCTGWQSILEAAERALGPADGSAAASGAPGPARDPLLAAWRAQLEGPAFQHSGADVVLGGGGFADDGAPPGAAVQLGADAPLAADLRAARAATGRVQGRNSTVPLTAPVPVPEGDLVPHAADDLGRAGLRGARCQLVPPGRAAGLPAGQRGRLRGQAAQPGARARPGPGRRDRGPRPRPVAPRGRGAAGPQAAPAGRGPAIRRDGRGACRPQPGVGRPGARPGAGARPVSRDRGGAGRGGRAARVARPAWRGVGRGVGGAGGGVGCRRAAGQGAGRGRRSLRGHRARRRPSPGRGARARPGPGDASTSRCGRARCSAR